MKKLFGVMFVLMFVFSFSLVSATTIVAGIVYHSPDITDIIEDADVVVSCAHNTSSGVVTNIQNTTSSSGGWYVVDFPENGNGACDDGDVVIVTATKGSLYGESMPVIVIDNMIGSLDIAIANVPIVPEFGFFVGMLTILSATIVFFVVRKE